MARTRRELHEELCKVLGSRNCYYSPPSSTLLNYPCILYESAVPSIDYADNKRYRITKCWTVIVVDEDPDSNIPERLEEHFEPYCSKNQEYASEGLQHFAYTLYY